MGKCPKCGNDVKTDHNYCENCGYPIDSLESEEEWKKGLQKWKRRMKKEVRGFNA